MFKLSLRGLFSAITLSAVATAWWLDRASLLNAIQAMQTAVMQAKIDVAAARANEQTAMSRTIYLDTAINEAKRLSDAGERIQIVRGYQPHAPYALVPSPGPDGKALDFAFAKGCYEDEVLVRKVTDHK